MSYGFYRLNLNAASPNIKLRNGPYSSAWRREGLPSETREMGLGFLDAARRRRLPSLSPRGIFSHEIL